MKLEKKNQKDLAPKAKTSLPQQSFRLLIALIGLSLFLHFTSYINFSQFVSRHKLNMKNNVPIKITMVPSKNLKFPNVDLPKKTVEVPLEKTEKPKEAKHQSFQDHIAEKETRVKVKPMNDRALEAAQKQAERQAQKKPESAPEVAKIPSKKNPKLTIESTGTLIIPDKQKQEKYKALMPTHTELSRLLDAGYQEYLDDNIALGDRVDINTTEYRYMGYMSALRKSISLVWNYPMLAAQRGMQGETLVEFTIEKNGEVKKVRVAKSSGYKILDDAILEAVKAAAPFAPLPDGMGKNRLTIVGTFRYVLTSFLAGAHH